MQHLIKKYLQGKSVHYEYVRLDDKVFFVNVLYNIQFVGICGYFDLIENL